MLTTPFFLVKLFFTFLFYRGNKGTLLIRMNSYGIEAVIPESAFRRGGEVIGGFYVSE
jgi:hypothetical protein